MALPNMDAVIHLGIMAYRANRMQYAKEQLDAMIKTFAREMAAIMDFANFDCDAKKAAEKLQKHIDQIRSYEEPEDFAEMWAQPGFVEQEARWAVTPDSDYGSMCTLQSSCGTDRRPTDREQVEKDILDKLKAATADYHLRVAKCLIDLKNARQAIEAAPTTAAKKARSE